MYKQRRDRKQSALTSLGISIEYNPKSDTLIVILARALHFPEYSNEACMISVFLSLGTVIYHTPRLSGNNPEIGETFTFNLSEEMIKLEEAVLKFNIWMIDKYSQKSPFGYVHINVKKDLAEQEIIPARMRMLSLRWYQVKCTESITDESLHGKLLVSLCYLPAANRIGIILMKALNLIVSKDDKALVLHTSLMHKEEKVQQKKLELKRATSSPVFNREVTFNMTDSKGVLLNQEKIAPEISIDIEVFVKKPSKKKERLGSISIGAMECIQRERYGTEHWQETMEKPRTAVAHWHDLKK